MKKVCFGAKKMFIFARYIYEQNFFSCHTVLVFQIKRKNAVLQTCQTDMPHRQKYNFVYEQQIKI